MRLIRNYGSYSVAIQFIFPFPPKWDCFMSRVEDDPSSANAVSFWIDTSRIDLIWISLLISFKHNMQTHSMHYTMRNLHFFSGSFWAPTHYSLRIFLYYNFFCLLNLEIYKCSSEYLKMFWMVFSAIKVPCLNNTACLKFIFFNPTAVKPKRVIFFKFFLRLFILFLCSTA